MWINKTSPTPTYRQQLTTRASNLGYTLSIQGGDVDWIGFKTKTRTLLTAVNATIQTAGSNALVVLADAFASFPIQSAASLRSKYLARTRTAPLLFAATNYFIARNNNINTTAWFNQYSTSFGNKVAIEATFTTEEYGFRSPRDKPAFVNPRLVMGPAQNIRDYLNAILTSGIDDDLRAGATYFSQNIANVDLDIGNVIFRSKTDILKKQTDEETTVGPCMVNWPGAGSKEFFMNVVGTYTGQVISGPQPGAAGAVSGAPGETSPGTVAITPPVKIGTLVFNPSSYTASTNTTRGSGGVYFNYTGNLIFGRRIEGTTLGKDYTIECFLKIGSQPTVAFSQHRNFYILSIASLTNMIFRVGLSSENSIGVTIASVNKFGTINMSYTFSSIVNKWIHLCIMRKSQKTSIYVNGVSSSASSAFFSDSIGDVTLPSGLVLSLGNIVRPNESSLQPFNGEIGSLRIIDGIAQYSLSSDSLRIANPPAYISSPDTNLQLLPKVPGTVLLLNAEADAPFKDSSDINNIAIQTTGVTRSTS